MNKNQIKILSKKVKKFIELEGNYLLATRLFSTNKLKEVNNELFVELGLEKSKKVLEKKFLKYNMEITSNSDFLEIHEFFYFSFLRDKDSAMNEQFLQDILNSLCASSVGILAVSLAKKFSLLGYDLKVNFNTNNDVSLESFLNIVADEVFCYTNFYSGNKALTSKASEAIKKLDLNIDAIKTNEFYYILAELAIIKAYFKNFEESKSLINFLLEKNEELGILFGEEESFLLLLAIFIYKKYE